MTNYSKAFIELLCKSNVLRLIQKNLKGFLLWKMKILAKLLVYLRFIKRTMLALVIQRLKKTWMKQQSIISDFSLCILEMRAAHIQSSVWWDSFIWPRFISTAQASERAIFKLLRPDVRVNSSYLQLDRHNSLLLNLPVLADKVSKDKEQMI